MKTYAFSDVHGNYKLVEAVLNYCQSDDVIYFLGDGGDRGPDGVKCIQRLLNDPRVIYIKGNHEQMFIDGIWSKWHNEGALIWDSQWHLWKQNGGSKTYRQFMGLTHQERVQLLNELDYLPLDAIYVNKTGCRIYLSHAGTDAAKIGTPFADILWDRSHISHYWTDEKIFDNLYIVHGHTPVQHFDLNKQIYQYAHKHKIDIDMGTYLSNTVALLDLDSIGTNKLEVKYFTC